MSKNPVLHHEQGDSSSRQATDPKGGVLAVQESYSGPLPSSNYLADFEKVKPGLADTIVSMAIKEQDHRHKIETKQTNFSGTGVWLGLYFGGIGLFSSIWTVPG